MPIQELTISEAAADWGAFDMVIDVRSPAEFAEDRIPGAVNLPVLDDAERAKVGTIYVQDSRFRARKIGAALVARNVARHLETALADKPGDFAPLVHCWRGGQRSRGMAIILDQIGWRVRTLAGGYKGYRARVVERLYEAEPWFEAVLIDGPTGVGKTELLARLAARGAAVLDLEGIAAHRGSVFGADPSRPQPSQKLFESLLLDRLGAALAAAPPGAPLFLEAESSKIGQRLTPPTLWKAMRAAPAIRLDAPIEARARYSLAAYADVAAEPSRLGHLLEKLIPLVGREQVASWSALAAAGEHLTLAEELMARHYDPSYARSGLRSRRILGRVKLAEIGEADLDQAAEEILQMTNAAAPAVSATV